MVEVDGRGFEGTGPYGPYNKYFLDKNVYVNVITQIYALGSSHVTLETRTRNSGVRLSESSESFAVLAC